jgi:hypothetical protein
MIWWNTGWSTPAENVWNQRRFGIRRHAPKNAAVRSGNASPEKQATSMRARSSSATSSLPRSATTSRSGASAASRAACRSATTSVQNSAGFAGRLTSRR